MPRWGGTRARSAFEQPCDRKHGEDIREPESVALQAFTGEDVAEGASSTEREHRVPPGLSQGPRLQTAGQRTDEARDDAHESTSFVVAREGDRVFRRGEGFV